MRQFKQGIKLRECQMKHIEVSFRDRVMLPQLSPSFTVLCWSSPLWYPNQLVFNLLSTNSCHEHLLKLHHNKATPISSINSFHTFTAVSRTERNTEKHRSLCRPELIFCIIMAQTLVIFMVSVNVQHCKIYGLGQMYRIWKYPSAGHVPLTFKAKIKKDNNNKVRKKRAKQPMTRWNRLYVVQRKHSAFLLSWLLWCHTICERSRDNASPHCVLWSE